VPQGGPLSPLPANIMLDPLDRQIEAPGLPFVRYADDFLILAKIREEAEAALEQVREFIEGKLKLLINPDKTKVAPLKECEFLGFRVDSWRIIRPERSARRFKYRIKEVLPQRLLAHEFQQHRAAGTCQPVAGRSGFRASVSPLVLLSIRRSGPTCALLVYSQEPPCYGPVWPVVWGRGGSRSP